MRTEERKSEPANEAVTAIPAKESDFSAEDSVHVSGELPRFRGPERFETGLRIGSGGMGEVVLQLDKNIGREIAKKMLHVEMERDVSIQRFIREARVQGQLEHPSVVPVHDFGVDGDGRLFFSMKRVRGQTLAQILERLARRDKGIETRFSRHKLLSAFVQVCLAIEYAHKRGVIHRDLKPSNVMLGDYGEVYVLDWGLAKLTGRAHSDDAEALQPKDGEAAGPEMTSDGDLLGTPLYMAPEQLRGRHAVLDERADVFSLGVLLFEILTLEPFRRGKTIHGLIVEAETAARAERPSQRVADIPPELDELCASALAADPTARLGSARALADAVERYLEGDRDMVARRAQATALVRSARAGLAGSAADPALAMRDVLKALALAPGDEEAQRLLVTLILESSRELSPEASRAFADRDAETRAQGLRRGMVALIMWLCTLPAAMIVGVRDWSMVATLVGITVVCLVATALVVRSATGSRSRTFPRVLAAMTAVVVGLGSAYLGPFVLTPLAACAASTMFLIHATRDEAPALLGIWLVAILATFGVEWLHLVPPAYSFQGGEVVLHARMLRLPEVPTVAFLAYTTVSFVGVLGYFVAQLRGKQRAAERQLFGQAWLLQRLFPSPASAPSKGATLPTS